jgi:hypothetical protein
MAGKFRDYRAEYQQRIARALAKGFSRTQGRGHPKAGEAYISAPPKPKPAKAAKGPSAIIDPKRPEERAIKAMKGDKLTEADEPQAGRGIRGHQPGTPSKVSEGEYQSLL